MTTTALLLVEVNGWFSKKVNFVSMVEHTLGKWGKALCLSVYLFLFYALLVAYISGSGSLFATLLQNGFHLEVPAWTGSALFVFLFGIIVYLGTRQVDLWNRALMTAKIVFFLILVLIGVRSVEPALLTHSAPSLAIFSLPILVISFGFHNMIRTTI